MSLMMMSRTEWQHRVDLEQLLDQIWESLTDTPAVLDFSTPEFSVPDGTPLISAAVHLRGDWDGTVRILCTDAMAERIAGHMLAQPTAALIRDDVNDALGEVANIIGGNVKSLLDGVEKLSLPEVQRFPAPGDVQGDHLHTCIARWRDLLIVVQVIEAPQHRRTAHSN